MIYLIVMEVSIPEHGGGWTENVLVGAPAFESMEDAKEYLKKNNHYGHKIISVPIF